MKTLDEVIETAPYVGTEWTNDALHYLMEYQRVVNVLHKHGFGSVWGITLPNHQEIEGKPDIDGSLNQPLTWDELRQMEGKPVWLEYNLHLSDKDARSRSRMWIIVQKILPWRQDDELIYYSGFVFSKEEIDETWQAYRKERE